MDPLQNLEVRAWTAPPAILNPLSVRFEPGRITALLGPNGAGKSTLLKQLFRITGAERVQLLGVGSAVAFPLKVVEAIGLGVEGASDEAIRAVARLCGIEFLLDRQMHGLSGGEIQKTHLARALLRDPQALLLDEAVSRLDWGALRSTLILLDQWVRQPFRGNGTRWVVWVSHDLESVRQFASDVVWMQCGALMGQGATRELLADDWLSRIYRE